MNNIHIQNEDYASQDHIQVANGVGLKIAHISTSNISFLSKSFVHIQILLVLDTIKNLLLIQCFCLDNHVFFEFHVSFFLVNDYLRKILHQGPPCNGLYNFSLSFGFLQSQSLSSVQVSANVWHWWLSHVFFLIINKAISFPILNNKHSICSHCQMVKSHALPFKNSHIVVLKPLALLYLDV